MIVIKIGSGGQTGADRGGLEAADRLGLRRGGVAPAGWRAEDGVIPEWYRTGMTESDSWAYRPRTKANVLGHDGTLIVSFGELPFDSGSMLTYQLARQYGRPCLHMIMERLEHPVGRALILGWLEGRNIRTLNIAGPRESREPGLQAAACRALVALLGRR